MRFIALIFLALISCAHAQVPMTGAGLGAPVSGGGGTTLSIDGSGCSASATAASTTCNITTTKTNDVIVIMAATHTASIATVTVNGIAATHRASSPVTDFEEWYYVSSGTLSGVAVVVTPIATTFISQMVIAINGAHTAAPFDINGVLPVQSSTDPMSVSTTAANTIILGGYRFGSTAAPTAGSGFTQQFGANYALLETKIVSAAQSGLSVTATTGAGDANGGVGDAIVQGP